MAFTNMLSNADSYSQYIVTGAEYGPFATIQSALDQAKSDYDAHIISEKPLILVRPGTYTENLTLYDGYNIQGADKKTTIIYGKHTPPTSGIFSISKCTLKSDTDAFYSTAAGTANLNVSESIFDIDNGYVFNIASWAATDYILIDSCLEDSLKNAILNNASGTSSLKIINSDVGADSTAVLIPGATLEILNSHIYCAINSSTNTNFALANLSYTTFEGLLSFSGASSTVTIMHSTIKTTDANGAIVITSGTPTVTISNSIIDTNASYAITCTTPTLTITAHYLSFLNTSAVSGIVYSTTSSITPSISVSPMSADGTLATNTVRYNTKTSALLTATLPTSAPAGSIIVLQGTAAGSYGFKIAQNANQKIQVGSTATTPGVSGYIQSTDANDGVMLLCTVKDTVFNATLSPIGNLTIA